MKTVSLKLQLEIPLVLALIFYESEGNAGIDRLYCPEPEAISETTGGVFTGKAKLGDQVISLEGKTSRHSIYNNIVFQEIRFTGGTLSCLYSFVCSSTDCPPILTLTGTVLTEVCYHSPGCRQNNKDAINCYLICDKGD